MVFPREKILTIDAETYMKSTNIGGYPYRYNYVGVHADSIAGNSIEDFQKKVPEGAEVVTDFKQFNAGSNFRLYLSGTALIPKK